MLIVLQKKNDQTLITHIQELLQRKYDADSHIIGQNKRVIAVPGDTMNIDVELLRSLEGVLSVDRVHRPYKLASRQQKDRTTIRLHDACTIGNREQCVVIAGPCSVESEGQLDETAAYVHEQGVNILRGGAFKPRTGPYAFNGLGEKGLQMLRKTADKYGMSVDTEAMSVEQMDLVEEYADIIQIGARNMQNYDLLRRAGKAAKPVLLKRGLSSTLEEWLLAAEYILHEGNPNVILCERGIRTFEQEVRFTLCLGSIPALRELTHLPIIVDPSHSAGKARWVDDCAKAAIAVGADGVIIETHPRPEEALSDGPQSLTEEQFADCQKQMRVIATAMGKKLV
ncbi:MAG: 3-deoxy-7-phosphoheptulonate synthase [Candidatus Peribacteraceae bacterium]|jgi:3-deoxy-7-phosphoheptulonate synthase